MNKKLLFACLLLVLIHQVAALDASDVRLGDANQQRGVSVTAAMTVSNPDSALSNLHIAPQGINLKYGLNATLPKSTLAQGESMTVIVSGFVPLDLNAVDTRGRPVSVTIGTLLISGQNSNGTTVTRTVTVFMQAEDNLKFASKSKIVINSKDYSLRDNKRITDVKRGYNADVTIEVENRFSTSGDCNVESRQCDVTNVDGNIESLDSDLDVNEDLSFNTLRPNRKDTQSFSFDIPSDLSDGSYDFTAYVTGTDENGALHGDQMDFTLEVNVPSDEVTITSADLSPSTLTCNQTRTTLTVTLKNTGNDDQDKASIFLDSSRLDIKDSVYNIDVSADDEVTRTFDLSVPKGLAPGQYFIQVIGNVQNSKETDRQSATLVIGDCVAPVQNPPPSSNTGSSTEVNLINPPATGMIVGTTKQNTQDNTLAYLFLGGIGVVAILMLLILVVMLVKR